MPIAAYFKGNGSKVMANMTKEYGPKKGKSVFYATANKKGETAKDMSSHINGMKKAGKLKSGAIKKG